MFPEFHNDTLCRGRGARNAGRGNYYGDWSFFFREDAIFPYGCVIVEYFFKLRFAGEHEVEVADDGVAFFLRSRNMITEDSRVAYCGLTDHHSIQISKLFLDLRIACYSSVSDYLASAGRGTPASRSRLRDAGRGNFFFDIVDEIPIGFSCILLFDGPAVDGDHVAELGGCKKKISLILFVLLV